MTKKWISRLRPKDVSLIPRSDRLNQAFVLEKWNRAHEENWALGYGRGIVGVENFLIYFRDALPRLVEVRQGQDVVGFVDILYQGESTRTAQLFLFLAPHQRRFALAATALWLAIDYAFSVYPKLHRVEAPLLSINKGGISFLRHFGFTQEGIKRHAFWMGINSFDVALLRLLRPEWKRLKVG